MSYIINFNVKEECAPEFANIVSSVKKELPDVEGSHAVEIFNDIKSPHQYTLVESWAEKELHEKHIQNLIEAGSWKAISRLLVTKPTGAYFNQLM